MSYYTAHWELNTLVYSADYGDGSTESLRMERCELTDPRCQYWVAVNGQCFGITEPTGQTCIASVDHAVSYVFETRNTYVIWRPKTVTPTVLKRWVSKWSKRTLPEPVHA